MSDEEKKAIHNSAKSTHCFKRSEFWLSHIQQAQKSSSTSLLSAAVRVAKAGQDAAASMIHQKLATDPCLKPKILVIAIGASSTGWAHVTDSAFWVVKEYLGVSLSEALKKFTGGTVAASIVALLATLCLSHIIS